MKHEEAFELLAVLALDAVDENERRAIEEHVTECPKCQSELDSYLEVAGALGNSVEPLPEGLWLNISSQIYSTEEQEHPMPVLPMGISEIARAREHRDRPNKRGRNIFAGLSSLAAAAIVVLSVNLASANSHVTNLQHDAGSNASVIASALAAPGHRIVTLSSATSKNHAEFVLLSDGRGYLVSSNLPTLSSSLTYQLWGVFDGKAISIGIMGSKPTDATFTVSGATPSVFGITIEPSGGSPTPTSAMVASATV